MNVLLPEPVTLMTAMKISFSLQEYEYVCVPRGEQKLRNETHPGNTGLSSINRIAGCFPPCPLTMAGLFGKAVGACPRSPVFQSEDSGRAQTS